MNQGAGTGRGGRTDRKFRRGLARPIVGGRFILARLVVAVIATILGVIATVFAVQASVVGAVAAAAIEPVSQAASQTISGKAPGEMGYDQQAASDVVGLPAPFTNPVFPGDAADPGALRVGEYVYVVATESMYYGKSYRLGILRSSDLVRWDVVGEVFPDRLPAWVDESAPSLWAPDLVYHDGKYYVYFSAREAPNRHGIGVAWSDSPEGPWEFSDQPLVVGDSFRHIDPMIFRDDDGTRYMYWGSAHGPILVQELSADGLSLVGEPRPVLHPAQGLPYQGLIEAPWVIKREGYYYLFYSGNSPGEYAISVARSESPLGPFYRNPRNPIVEENEYFRAPGHNAIVQDDAGQDWILYHAYDRYRYGVGRHLMLDKIEWVDGWPVVNGGLGPSWTEQWDGPVFRSVVPEGTDRPGAETLRSADDGLRADKDGSVVSETPLFDVARGKVAYASSVRGPEFAAVHAVDGTTRTRWAPAVDDPSPWLVVDLGGEYRIRRTEIRFRSTHFTRTTRDPALTHDPFRIEQHYLYRVDYSLDGKTWHPFADRSARGQVAYPYIDTNDVVARYVRVTITELFSTRPDPGIFDLRVFGHRDFWLEVPGWQTPVSDDEPVILRSLGDDVSQVTVWVDGIETLATDGVPTGPIVDASRLVDGWHDVTVWIEKSGGIRQSAAAKFWVQNTSIEEPRSGEVLQGRARVKVAVGVAEDWIENVSVTVSPVDESPVDESPVGESTAGVSPFSTPRYVLYEGDRVPEVLELDTMGLADGTYEIAVTVSAGDGVVSSAAARVEIHNWDILVDPLPPPQPLGWFGTREALQVVERSEGWDYVTSSPEEYFGDKDRLALADEPAAVEYLIWRMPSLHSFAVRIYAAGPGELESVRAAVSRDMNEWHPIDVEVEALDVASTGWREFDLRGEVPTLVVHEVAESGDNASAKLKTDEYQYFRLSVVVEDDRAPQLQLGEVVLKGRRQE